MTNDIDPGFDSGVKKEQPSGVEDEIAAARQALAEAREMLEGALKKTEEVFGDALDEVPGAGEAAAP